MFVYFLIHLLFLLIIISGWRRIRFEQSTEVYLCPVSVLIPVRNDKNNLRELLNDIKNQDFPVDMVEIIVINDHSEDGSHEVALEFQSQSHNLRFINLTNLEGKKNALKKGVESSKNDLIATLDSDCRIGSQWLLKSVQHILNEKADLVFGLVTFIKERNIIAQMISIEQKSLVGSGAALWRIGLPIMSNGANMIFKRDAFENVKGYEGNLDIPSGDDTFLLSKFKKAGLKIGFNPLLDGMVWTKGPASMTEFINQRRRWAGKLKYSQDFAMWFIAILIFFLNCSWLVFLVMVFLSKITLAYFLLGTTVKISLEYFFIYSISNKMNEKVILLPFMILELIYPLYVTFFAFVSNLDGYEWKGRRYR